VRKTQLSVFKYQTLGEETKDKFPIKKLKKALRTPKCLRLWNGKQARAKEMKEEMNYADARPAVW